MIAGYRGDSGDSLRRFQAEAEAAATLEHPNIVPIYEVGNHDDRHYFTMKLVGGGSLKEMLSDGPLDTRIAAQIASALSDAIHYAHQRAVLHRDLKPANILIDNRGEHSSGSGHSRHHSIGKERFRQRRAWIHHPDDFRFWSGKADGSG